VDGKADGSYWRMGVFASWQSDEGRYGSVTAMIGRYRRMYPSPTIAKALEP
jgi:hypothetical protein